MKLTSYTIETQKTARYYSLGSFEDVNELWICLHGYAHRAESFIENFRPIAKDIRLFIAPEGLSRFYTKGFGGTVGASWMTSEDRGNEIKDYVFYLEKLYKEVLGKCSSKPNRIVQFGFSQGGPAILRAIAEAGIIGDEIVLWSGDVPRDLNFEKFINHAKNARKWLIFSKTDPLVSKDIYLETETLLKSHSIKFEVLHFEGGHEIPELVLKELVNRF